MQRYQLINYKYINKISIPHFHVIKKIPLTYRVSQHTPHPQKRVTFSETGAQLLSPTSFSLRRSNCRAFLSPPRFPSASSNRRRHQWRSPTTTSPSTPSVATTKGIDHGTSGGFASCRRLSCIGPVPNPYAAVEIPAAVGSLFFIATIFFLPFGSGSLRRGSFFLLSRRCVPPPPRRFAPALYSQTWMHFLFCARPAASEFHTRPARSRSSSCRSAWFSHLVAPDRYRHVCCGQSQTT
jgi:hypothetical protein